MGSVLSAAFNRDGTRAVTGSRDNLARIWDTKSGRLVGVPLDILPVQPGGEVRAVAFSPDGKTVVTGHAANCLQRWDAPTAVKPKLESYV